MTSLYSTLSSLSQVNSQLVYFLIYFNIGVNEVKVRVT